jgi:general secretion pathway protein E
MIDAFVQILERTAGLSGSDSDKIRAAYLKDRSRLIESVVETRLVLENQVLEALSELYDMPFTALVSVEHVKERFTSVISRHFLKKCLMVPLVKETAAPVIAVNDPSDLSYADDIAAMLDLEAYSLVLAPRSQILTAINALYDRSGESAQQLVDTMEDNGFTLIDEFERTMDLLDDTSDAPVIRLVNHMISQAVKAGASDIHVEPFQEVLKIRYRIDGILYEMFNPPKGLQASLISRVKVMAKMNIAEKRVPQDGRAQVRIGDQEIDIRISTVPTSHGERLVMRLLNKSGYFLEFSQFGLSVDNYRLIHKIIRQNNGIVLVTGPTGSGKTTTLYAALSKINSPDKNIITIEDPVEYNLQGIGQIQVNNKTGITFARGLRAIVRQDPDIVLIGEIRDLETAEIAIQSALTGHLVFSTLHTNDSAGAVTRLVDLGVEPYLIASSVNSVIAQRLVRVLCPACKVPYQLDETHTSVLNTSGEALVGKQAYKPVGCSRCFNTGYAGRQAIFEIMLMTDELKSLVLKTSDANQIRAAALSAGMVTLRRDGMAKVVNGITSIDEVLRVTQE